MSRRGTLRLSGALALTLVVATLACAPDVGAKPARQPGVPGLPPASAAVEDGRAADGRIVAPAPELDEVPATSALLDRLVTRRRDLENERDTNIRAVADTEGRLTRLGDDLGHLAAILVRAERRLELLEREDRAHRSDLTLLTARSYAAAGLEVDPVLTDAFLPPEVRITRTYERVLSEYAANDTIGDTRVIAARLLKTGAEVQDLRRRIGEAEREAAGLAREADEARFRAAALNNELAELAPRIDDARAEAMVEGTDLSMVALDAYWRAARRLAEEQPACGLRWWALAGIGRTESRHGTYAGGYPARDGRVTEEIIGIALDGTRNTAVITDTDGGALDGDPVHDRAVGPMQFIPGTWRAMAEDQSGDGIADPQNIHDAALAAARYLCRSGPGLDADDGMRRAFLTYNRSLSYVETVLGYAHGYRDAVALPLPAADR